MRALILLAWGASGCGIVAQTIAGWNEESFRSTLRTQPVRIESTPEGAQVTRTDPKGNNTILGATPLVDQVEYEVEETIQTPKAWALLATGLAELAAGGVLTGVGFARQEEVCDIVDMMVECHSTGGTGFFVGGAAVGVFGVIDTVWGLIRLFQEPEVIGSRILEPKLIYAVEKDGVSKTAEIAVPTADSAKFDLSAGTVTAIAPPPPPPSDSKSDARVVAVMDVEDANEGGSEAVGGSLVRNLSDQLRIFVAQQGIKTIDRTAQEETFRARIQELKLESQKPCVDDGCQIELGKALAASHILRSKITKFGSRCVLNGELIDLTREVTIKAASTQGACQAEGFLEMSETLARDLMKQ
jgi:hypothetical protein